MAAGQLFSLNTQGGYYYSNQLSNDLRMKTQPMTKFRQFCDGPADAFGLHRGQTYTWDIVNDTVNAGGVISETNTIPQTNYTLTQGTLTVTEWGVAVPWTGLVEDLGKFDLSMPTGRALKNNCIKALDFGAWYQFLQTPLHAVASSGTDTASIQLFTNGTVTGTNSVAFGTGHIKTLVDLMKSQPYNIPAFLGDDYYAISNVSTIRNLKNQLELLHQYTATGFDLIMKGEVGRYENTRFVEQSNIPAGVASTVAPGPGSTFTAWVNGKSDWMFLMGEDTVMEGVAEPEHLRYAIPTDYGRSKGMAWYALLGFGITHTQAADARIVMWDSQA